MKIFLLGLAISMLSVGMASAHGGGLDGSGGHNCNVGYCEGSYHYHYGGDKSTDYDVPEGYVAPTPTPEPAPAAAPQAAVPLVYYPVITTETETETEVVEFEVVREDSDELLEGEEEVRQKGIDGEKTITYVVTKSDEEETDRVKKSEEITKEPLEEIRLVGTRQQEVAVVESDQAEELPEEPEEATPAEAAAGFAILGGGGYAGYKYLQKKRKP